MSTEEAQEQGLKLVPAWWPVLGAIVACVFGVGGAFVTSNLTNAYQDKRLDSLESRYESLNSRLANIDRNITRMASKLGIEER